MQLTVIENEVEINQIPTSNDVYGYIVYSDSELHYMNNLPLYVFFFDMHFEQCWAVDCHEKSIISSLNEKIHQIERIKTVDFYSFYISFKKQTYDLRMMHYLQTGLKIEDEDSIDKRFYHQLTNGSSKVNQLIPMVKHIGNAVEILKLYTMVSIDDVYKSYYQQYQCVAAKLMMNPIQITTSELPVYSFYNLYTLTGRPSNRFGGINFAAIPKDKRYQFIPNQNQYLINIDFRAYHVYLIAFLIGYSFTEYPYTALAQIGRAHV